MEADILRLILFLVGIAIIFGIYAADRYKRGRHGDLYRDWMDQPRGDKADHIEPSWDRIYEPAEEPDDDEPLYDASDEPYPLPEQAEEDNPDDLDGAINNELEQLEEILHEEHRYHPEPRSDQGWEMPQEQMSISFLARDLRKGGADLYDAEADLPKKIIQLNIVPHDERFYGDDILCAIHQVGLEPGEMDIFHYYGDDPDKRHAIYSMVNMVEPGIFPIDDMDDFSTPGLTLFSQLPGPKDGLSTFTEMLHAAEQLANLLAGELRDETHSALTKQTIGHIREEIQEHHRQLQLARSKR